MAYDPRKHGARCGSCPRKNQVPVPPEIRPGATWVWIGQDPGKQEVRQGRPFVGPTGTRLLHLWEEACRQSRGQVDRAQIHVTNAALCEPLSKNEKEARVAVDCCRPRLYGELRKVHPDAGVLVMGKWALYALTGREKGLGALSGFHIKINLKHIRSLCDAHVHPANAAPDDIAF